MQCCHQSLARAIHTLLNYKQQIIIVPFKIINYSHFDFARASNSTLSFRRDARVSLTRDATCLRVFCRRRRRRVATLGNGCVRRRPLRPDVKYGMSRCYTVLACVCVCVCACAHVYVFPNGSSVCSSGLPAIVAPLDV